MFFYVVLGFSRPDPVDENEDTYQNDAEDEYQDDTEDYAADYDDDNTSKDQSGARGMQQDKGKGPAYFEQLKTSKTANVSQTVALACPVKNLDKREFYFASFNQSW